MHSTHSLVDPRSLAEVGGPVAAGPGSPFTRPGATPMLAGPMRRMPSRRARSTIASMSTPVPSRFTRTFTL